MQEDIPLGYSLLKFNFFLHVAVHDDVGYPVIEEQLYLGSKGGPKIELLQAGVNEGMAKGVEGFPEVNSNDE